MKCLLIRVCVILALFASVYFYANAELPSSTVYNIQAEKLNLASSVTPLTATDTIATTDSAVIINNISVILNQGWEYVLFIQDIDVIDSIQLTVEIKGANRDDYVVIDTIASAADDAIVLPIFTNKLFDSEFDVRVKGMAGNGTGVMFGSGDLEVWRRRVVSQGTRNSQ